jgi:hypothetical protein
MAAANLAVPIADGAVTFDMISATLGGNCPSGF